MCAAVCVLDSMLCMTLAAIRAGAMSASSLLRVRVTATSLVLKNLSVPLPTNIVSGKDGNRNLLRTLMQCLQCGCSPTYYELSWAKAGLRRCLDERVVCMFRGRQAAGSAALLAMTEGPAGHVHNDNLQLLKRGSKE